MLSKVETSRRDKVVLILVGKEQAIGQIQERCESQIALKEREISNANDKLKTER